MRRGGSEAFALRCPADDSSVPSGRMTPAMDPVDGAILRELAADARLTMADLGRRIGLSRTATLARVRRLEDRGVIRGYHADVATDSPPAAHAARVGIVVRAADTAAYVAKLARFAEFRGAEAIAGEWDLLVALEAATA